MYVEYENLPIVSRILGHPVCNIRTCTPNHVELHSQVSSGREKK